MIPKPEQLKWQERVKQVALYHRSRLKENCRHTLRDTAAELKRSVGRVSEDLQLDMAMRQYPRVETFSTVQEALDYIRNIKRKIRLGEV